MGDATGDLFGTVAEVREEGRFVDWFRFITILTESELSALVLSTEEDTPSPINKSSV